jgi:hypothetical protein
MARRKGRHSAPAVRTTDEATGTGYACSGTSLYTRSIAHQAGFIQTEYVEHDTGAILRERIAQEGHSLITLRSKIASEPDAARRGRMKGSEKAILATLRALDETLSKRGRS